MNAKPTTYETITEMKDSGHWDFCMATFPKAWSLDFYYRIYTLVLEHYPSKPYGYAQAIASNPLITSKLGGVFADLQQS